MNLRLVGVLRALPTRVTVHLCALVLVLTHAAAFRSDVQAQTAATAPAPATGQAPATATAPTAAPATTPATGQTTAAAKTPGAALPRVRLVATGGTISNRPGGRLTSDELIKSVPELATYTRPEAEQFLNVASSEITLDQWVQLSRRVNTLLREERDLAGVVVTCGTDTLEELAYFLHLTVRSDKPVVVVGAMRRPGIPGYEGQANLLAGFRVAASPEARGRGAFVVLNDEILSAREATKTDAQRLDTFNTRMTGVLGVVDVDRVVFYRDVVKRHTAKSEFDVASITSLPRVDVLLTYQGAPGDLIRASADAGAKGIVIGTAAGATSGTQGEGIRYAAEKNVVVVRATRTGAGRIMGGANANAPRPQGNPQAGTNGQSGRMQSVAGEDLAPIKARILLMLALTKTSDPQEIQRMFLEY
jgi:L-asparaginase